jgi:hypothetical protein
MNRLSDENKKVLTNDIIAQAKLYLEDADEFYPFGTVIDNGHNIKPVSYYGGEEFPDSTELLEKLEEVIKAGIAKRDYLVAAIGVDVFLTVNGEKKTALQIRFYSSDSALKLYFIYYKKDGEYFFEPHNIES